MISDFQTFPVILFFSLQFLLLLSERELSLECCYSNLLYEPVAYKKTKYISYHAEPKKEINISAMKTHQTRKKWQHLTCIEVTFSN